MVLPLFGDAEQRWPSGVRGVLYGAGMIYFFVGVAIVADLFMAAIERITSRRKKVYQEDGRWRTEGVWNETIATLTLMALGSSAPEIFLSVIDVFKKGFKFGELGPATIVGSAAFNLLVIVSVCIATIPSNEVRMIRNVPAFFITAVFSLLAYVWMAIILSINTPEVVDLWEALATFLFFPILVYVSFITDRGDLDRCLNLFGCGGAGEEADEAPELPHISFLSEVLNAGNVGREQEFEATIVKKGPPPPTREPVSCKYRTEARTAVPGYDYEEVEGSIMFEYDQSEAHIKLKVLDTVRRIHRIEFLVILEDLEGDACFSAEDDGGDESAILTVILEPNEEVSLSLRRFDRYIGINSTLAGFAEWKEQFVGAFYCNGGPEEQKEASVTDWIAHIITMPWKVVIGSLPPVAFGGGWVCFFSTLGGIAVLTTIISDLAELFGCVVGIPDIVTAITFVALGTSMPDLFASLSAAKEDPSADASIVNVTGSNSVNVYLGLGVPWTVAAIYWELKGEDFVVESGNLAFSVGAFCYVCLLALGLLYLRRKMLKAELGGSFFAKCSSSLSFILFWILWVCIVSWEVLRGDDADTSEFLAILITTIVISLVATLAPVLAMRYRARLDVIAAELPRSFSRDMSLSRDPATTSLGMPPEKDKCLPRGNSSISDKERKICVTVDSATQGQGASVARAPSHEAPATAPQGSVDANQINPLDFFEPVAEEKIRAPIAMGIKAASCGHGSPISHGGHLFLRA